MKNFIKNLKQNLPLLAEYLRHYLIIAWLPLALIVIFILQNHLFNFLLDISPTHYIIRRTFVTAAFGVLLFGPAILLQKFTKYLYLTAISLLVTIIFITQYLYYSYSGGFMQVSALLYAGEGLSILDTVFTLLTYRLIFFIVSPLLIIGCFAWTIKKHLIEKMLLKKEKIIIGISMTLFIISGYGYLFMREYMEAGNTAHIYQYNKLFDVNALISKVGIINFSLGDALSHTFTTQVASAEDLNFLKTWKQNNTKNTKDQKYFGLAKGKNLIFIQVESLENSVINEKIHDQEITPNLNKLTKEGLYFPNYYAQIGPGTTADAEFSILNSFYPLPDTVAFIKHPYNFYSALPNLLKKNNYHTYSMHGDVSSFWNRANIYPQLGYEKWFDEQDYTVSRDIGVYDLGDEDFFNQSIPKLESLPRPFMTTLITLTSHTPYQLPTDLQTFSFPTSTNLNILQQNYVQSLRYTDQAIGNFIEKIKQNGLYDDSLIVILGDHGSFTNIGKVLKTKKTIFADLQNLQVPLIILAPNTKLRGTLHTPAGHIDIYPTVTNLLGINTGDTTMLGQDILNTKNPINTQRILISGTIKSIMTDKIAYHAGTEGKFEDAICLELPSKKRLPVENCRALYKKESDTVQASDLMIKNNLIDNSQTSSLKIKN